MYAIQKIFKDLQIPKKDIQKKFRNIKIEKPIVVVTMTARTGSTAFCDLLSNDKRIDSCKELFNPRGYIQYRINKSGTSNISFTNYIKEIENSLSGDYFSFKTSWQDYSFFAENDIDNIFLQHSNFIFLDRLDIENQSVSLYYSEETNIWHSNQRQFSKRAIHLT